MSDPGAPRQTKGWPLIAISLLILLLAGFLVLKWRKREEIPAIVKEPPPPAQHVVPVKPADPLKPGPAPPVDVAAKPADSEFEEHVKHLKKALEEQRWEDAAAAFEAARKLRPDAAELKGAGESIAEGRKKEEAERAEAARKAELKRKQEREWAILREQVEKDRAEDLWDKGIAALEKFSQEHPDALRDEDYAKALRSIKDRQKEADGYFKKDLAEAQKHFDAGRYPQALALAGNALKYYPERKAQVREFQDRVRELQFAKTMIRIPATPCWIGGESRESEKPLRQVKLAAFLIDTYEVTNEDYAAFVSATGHEAPLYWPERKLPRGRERHPVVFVSWDDAAAYAKWAGKRLPTAEEWEVAARGPDQREFPWGSVFMEKEDKFPCNCLEFWQVNKSEPPGTTAVDDKRFDNGASVFGVFGMGGNVWEWTATSATATGTKPPPEFRVLKGGSFMTPQKSTRCANVYAEDPRLPHPDVGFRCARDVK